MGLVSIGWPISVCFSIHKILLYPLCWDFLLDHPIGGHLAMTTNAQEISVFPKSNWLFISLYQPPQLYSQLSSTFFHYFHCLSSFSSLINHTVKPFNMTALKIGDFTCKISLVPFILANSLISEKMFYKACLLVVD